MKKTRNKQTKQKTKQTKNKQKSGGVGVGSEIYSSLCFPLQFNDSWFNFVVKMYKSTDMDGD